MDRELREVVGSRGENILELSLTEYDGFQQPLFRPGFLGDKWPGIDYYVELTSVAGKRPYFFAQVKATSAALGSPFLTISSKKEDIEHLLQIPGPTYVFGVHVPTHRVFVRAVHLGAPIKAIRRIPFTHELTPANLSALHDEVAAYWTGTDHKPKASKFT